jgi:hypothetical protein
MLEATMKRLVKAGEELVIQVQECRDYSGRGMFGSTTCGVSLEASADLLPLVAKAANQLNEDELAAFIDEVANVRTDSMGRGIIVY